MASRRIRHDDEPTPTATCVLERLTALHPKKHRSVAGPHPAAARTRWAIRSGSCRPSSMSPAPTARARSAPSARHAGGGGLSRACLHLAASGALSRAHPPRRRADRGGGAARRSSKECERANGDEPITFFEITTGAAFLAFTRIPADIVLLETGLGGRLDATNVIEQPLVTVDHADLLRSYAASRRHAGQDRRREGRHHQARPCRWWWRRSRPRRGGLRGARRRSSGRRCPAMARNGPSRGGERAASSPTGWASASCRCPPFPARIRFPMPAPHSPALPFLEGFAIDEAMRQMRGLAQVEWPARLQRLTRGPLAERLPPGWELWLDGGHNESAGAALADFARARGAKGSSRTSAAASRLRHAQHQGPGRLPEAPRAADPGSQGGPDRRPRLPRRRGRGIRSARPPASRPRPPPASMPPWRASWRRAASPPAYSSAARCIWRE